MFPLNPKIVALLLISIPFASARGENPFRAARHWSAIAHRQGEAYVRYVQDPMRPVSGLGVIQQDALNILHGAAQLERIILLSPGAHPIARRLRYPVRDLNRMVENAQRNIQRLESDYRHHAMVGTFPFRSDIPLDRGIAIHVDKHGVHPVPIQVCPGMDPQERAQLRILHAKLTAMQKTLVRLDKSLRAM